MKTWIYSLACVALTGGAVAIGGGCTKKKPAASSKPAMTQPVAVAPAAGPALKAEDLTHTVSMDTPLLASKTDVKPLGMLKKGDKVLVMAPGKMAQVTTADGKKGYVATASLAPIGK